MARPVGQDSNFESPELTFQQFQYPLTKPTNNMIRGEVIDDSGTSKVRGNERNPLDPTLPGINIEDHKRKDKGAELPSGQGQNQTPGVHTPISRWVDYNPDQPVCIGDLSQIVEDSAASAVGLMMAQMKTLLVNELDRRGFGQNAAPAAEGNRQGLHQQLPPNPRGPQPYQGYAPPPLQQEMIPRQPRVQVAPPPQFPRDQPEPRYPANNRLGGRYAEGAYPQRALYEDFHDEEFEEERYLPRQDRYAMNGN